MANVIDYIEWRGDVLLSQTGVDEVDNLIFCLLSYVDFDGIVSANKKEGITVREAAKEYFFTHDPKVIRPLGLIVPGTIVELFRTMAHAPRYKDLILCGYVNEICEKDETQFSAITVRLPGGGAYVAYRGTDDTIVGWREDFNLSWMHEVPAQRRAAMYLSDLDLPEGAELYIGGHSKGGNLAIWGAIHAPDHVRGHIAHVFCNDGPGFSEDMIHTEEYMALADRITTLIPQSSLVGLLLDHDEHYAVIKSSQVGVFQHDGLSWEVCGNRFIRKDKLSVAGLRNETISSRIAAMTREERRTFTEFFFGVLESTGARTLTELNEGSLRNAITMLRTVGSMDKAQRELVTELIIRLFDLKPLAAAVDATDGEVEVQTRKGKVTVELRLLKWLYDRKSD